MAVMRMREALRDAMAEEMRRDEDVFVMGEDVGVFQGSFKVTEGLLDEFGEKRVRDTPISENSIVGVGVGAGMGGLRPIVEIMTVNFALLAMDQIVNHAAAIPYMFGGQVRVPVVVRMPGGGGHQLGPTHSHSFEAMFLQIPGLLVACPSTPADGKGLLKAAIRDDNPCVFLEHKWIYRRIKEIVSDDPDRLVPIGKADVKREGTDVSVITHGMMVHLALEAAETLANEGIQVEVLDLRTVQPLDAEAILATVTKTSRAVVLYESQRYLGTGAEVASLIAEEAFESLDAPVVRLSPPHVPVPFSPPLEDAYLPQVSDIEDAVRKLSAW
jgi:pyruvate dehydrogenase E1 component beta subunit